MVDEVKGYYLRDLIGTGGFGEVYRAYQPTLDRNVAIKVILPKHSNDASFIRRFRSEAQIIAHLEHLHIVPLYDYWRDPSGAYLVMRLLEGGSLRHRLVDEHKLTLVEIMQVMNQIGSALASAHKENIIHQDIKPENILFDRDGNAFLTDFGIAKSPFNEESDNIAESFGSPAYVSPEIAGRRQSVIQSDIYSLGILLFELLAGRPPFMGKPIEVINKHIHSPLPSIEKYRNDLPPKVAQVLWRAAAKSPQARYATIEEFLTAFGEALNMDRPRFAQVQQRKQAVVGQSDERDQTQQIFAENPDATLNIEGMAVAEPPADEPLADRIPQPEVTIEFDVPPSGEPEVTLEFAPVAETQIKNPYMGLKPFKETDTNIFYGRRELTGQLVTTLENNYFLAVVGPSGSGKSSVVRAGVIPSLKAGHVKGSGNWFYVTLTPGSNPVRQLQEALLSVSVEHFEFDPVTGSSDDVLRVCRAITSHTGSEIVLFIDQFEEVFTQVDSEEQRLYFLNNLYTASAQKASRVIATLRADYYDRPLMYGGFGNLFTSHMYSILPLSEEQLYDAIVLPAKNEGIRVEGQLVDIIVKDVVSQPGALPLLQYTLSELFEHRDGLVIPLTAYMEIGGIAGALASRSEEIYENLSIHEREVARQLFLQLVTVVDDQRVLRRRVLMADTFDLGFEREMMHNVQQKFAASRLLTFDYDPATREPTVEIAHEVLLEGWDRFKSWIDDNRDLLRNVQRLEAAASEWIQGNRGSDYLARGSLLAQFEALHGNNFISRRAQEFLDASLELRQRIALRSRIAVATLVVLLIAASIAAVIAVNQSIAADEQRERADEQRDLARSRELATNALLQRDDIDLSLLLSLEALRINDTFEARNALLTSLQTEPRLLQYYYGHSANIRSLAYSPDESFAVSGGEDGRVIQWNLATGESMELEGNSGVVNGIAISPNKAMIAAVSNDGVINIWDSETGELLRTFSHENILWDVDFHPESTAVAYSDANGTVYVWELTEDAPQARQLHVDDPEAEQPLAFNVFSVAYHPTGDYILSGGDDLTIIVQDAATGEIVSQNSEDHFNWVRDIEFSPSGELFVTTGDDAALYVWEAEGFTLLNRVETDHTRPIWDVVFSPDSSYVATAGHDNTVRFYDPFSGEEVLSPITMFDSPVWSVDLSGDGQTLLTSNREKIATLSINQPLLVSHILMDHQSPIQTLALSPDGDLLASAGGFVGSADSDNAIRLWDTTTGELLHTLDQHLDVVTRVAFSPDGNWLASSSADTTVILWDLSGDVPAPTLLDEHNQAVHSIAFSADSRLLASAGEADPDGQIILWSVDSGRRQGTPITVNDDIFALAFSPDGRRLASGSRSGAVQIWDVNRREQVDSYDYGAAVHALVYRGDTLAIGGRANTIVLWDGDNEIILTGHTGWVQDLAFAGNRLVSASRDGTVRLWDLRERRQLGEPFRFHADEVNAVAVLENTIISAGIDQVILFTDIAPSLWQEYACQIANRNLRQDEWNNFLRESDYHETCRG
ncbi:MAG: protein kinase [Chloroflexi bacterium]|nr:protein kinase [Chloroflexota bacterium]